MFASTQTVFQNDDTEEDSIDGDDSDNDEDKRRSLDDQTPMSKTYVPTVGFDEPLFTVPGSYLIQVPRPAEIPHADAMTSTTIRLLDEP